MPAKVADASVLAAFVFEEPEAPEAARLLKNAELYEPTLLRYELASVARKKAAKAPAQREALLQALELGLAIDIRWIEVDPVACVELSLEAGLTTYDAAYLHVAELYGAELVTLDERLKASARRRSAP